MVATPYKVASRYHYEDANGRSLSVIPSTLRLSGTDVAAAKLTFDDLAGTPASFVVPPGPAGAVGIRFEDFKVLGAGATDVAALELLLGPTQQSTAFQVATGIAKDTSISAGDRMQGLDSMLFGISQTIAFNQKA